ncbi:MAG: tyrosine-type recombinase/integrase [Brotaphodocola sp.]
MEHPSLSCYTKIGFIVDVPLYLRKEFHMKENKTKYNETTQDSAERGQSILPVFFRDGSCLHWHDLRHSYATLMTKYGSNPKNLAELLGHSSEKIGEVYIDTGQLPVFLPRPFAKFLKETIPNHIDPPVCKITGSTFLKDILPYQITNQDCGKHGYQV